MINGSGNDLLIINSEFNRNTNNGVFFAASPIEIDAIVKNSTANDNLSDGFNVHGGKKIIFEECNAERNGNREVTSQGSDGDGYTFHGDSS
ncbi:MAG: hypothetical protein LBG59_00250 [Candidatus Peribacteria bacterium]|jgi:hypothetical protein|nr:hypothetical protein [Candidatus Peribacteria bacterium]